MEHRITREVDWRSVTVEITDAPDSLTYRVDRSWQVNVMELTYRNGRRTSTKLCGFRRRKNGTLGEGTYMDHFYEGANRHGPWLAELLAELDARYASKEEGEQ